MADIFPGDGALEKFINGNLDSSFPKELAMLLIALKEKMAYVTKLYDSVLNAYLKLSDKDPLREILKEHIIGLSKYSTEVIDQFDYILMNEDSGKNSYNKEEDLNDSGDPENLKGL